MKNKLVILGIFGLSCQAFAWGQTGHRVVGEVAQRHLTLKAAAAVETILNGSKLPDVANWADDIRSDENYKGVAPYHYADVGAAYKSYGEAPKASAGDAVVAINVLTDYLKSGNASAFGKTPVFAALTKEQALKLLVHFVGDVHQPLHAGDPADRGGNDVKVHFMNPKTDSNLHAVWDNDIIDSTKLSFSEYARSIDHVSRNDLKEWSSLNPADWINEGLLLRSQIYIYPDKQPAPVADQTPIPFISYVYIYKNRGTVEKRLLMGGIRLANLLNSILQ